MRQDSLIYHRLHASKTIVTYFVFLATINLIAIVGKQEISSMATILFTRLALSRNYKCIEKEITDFDRLNLSNYFNLSSAK